MSVSLMFTELLLQLVECESHAGQNGSQRNAEFVSDVCESLVLLDSPQDDLPLLFGERLQRVANSICHLFADQPSVWRRLSVALEPRQAAQVSAFDSLLPLDQHCLTVGDLKQPAARILAPNLGGVSHGLGERRLQCLVRLMLILQDSQ